LVETVSALDSNRARSLLTVLGIVIGISAVIAMTAIIGGIKNALVGEMVLKTFRRLREEGKTIVLITHDPEVAEWADRTVHIRDGKLYSDEEERRRLAAHPDMRSHT
jgi:ABC-type histidine transport system ATPase subunit